MALAMVSTEDLAWCETQRDQDRYIITWSKTRTENDLKARDDIPDKIR
jgi:hypothetical protein